MRTHEGILKREIESKKLSSFQLKEFKYLRFNVLFLVLWVNIPL